MAWQTATSARAGEAARWLWAALIVAAGLRLLLLWAVPVEQASDAQWYMDRAREMLATGRYAENGVSTAFWPVGYPAFLAGVMAIFGPTALVGQLANAALGVAAVWLVHRWCLLQFGHPRVAGVAALALAVYPNHLGYAVGLYTEPLYTALLLALLVVARSPWGLWRWGLAGLLAGAATLVKSQTLLLAPVLLALLALPAWRLAAAWRLLPALCLALAGMALVVAPWTWRNVVVMGAAVPVSTNGGISLLIANNDSMRWGQAKDYDDTDPVFREVAFSVADQVAADQRARALAREWITTHPDRFVSLMPWKLWRLWAYDGEAEWWFQHGYAGYAESRWIFRTVRGLNQVYYLGLLALGALGLWAALRRPGCRQPHDWTLPCLLLFFSALCAVFSGQARYHYPVMPLVVAYAAWWWVVARRGAGGTEPDLSERRA